MMNNPLLQTSRPYRNPYNLCEYNLWFGKLTEEEQNAERTLVFRKFYSEEGVETMFECKSKEGQQLHIDDIIELNGIKGVVIAILSATEVQFSPIEEGLPQIVRPEELTVKKSFIESLKGLRSNEELQAILLTAEERFTENKNKAKAGKKAASSSVEEEELDL